MARPLRIEFPGAVYHVTTRGHRREAIYEDDTDRAIFNELLAEAVDRYNWRCYAYCQMTDHYHLVIQTVDPNLSAGMRRLNGVYTQRSNARHDRGGHVFQGRYKAVLVDADRYLRDLVRDVVMNPVRAGMAEAPGDWKWSSYRATAGEAPAPAWLHADSLLARFARDREEARERFRAFVLNGVDSEDPWKNLRQQVYLGDAAFVRKMQAAAAVPDDPAVNSAHRRPPPPSLEEIAAAAGSRNEAIRKAYETGAYSYTELGRYFNLHPGSIGRIVRG